MSFDVIFNDNYSLCILYIIHHLKEDLVKKKNHLKEDTSF
jgi:hypothetical protein